MQPNNLNQPPVPPGPTAADRARQELLEREQRQRQQASFDAKYAEGLIKVVQERETALTGLRANIQAETDVARKKTLEANLQQELLEHTKQIKALSEQAHQARLAAIEASKASPVLGQDTDQKALGELYGQLANYDPGKSLTDQKIKLNTAETLFEAVDSVSSQAQRAKTFSNETFYGRSFETADRGFWGMSTNPKVSVVVGPNGIFTVESNMYHMRNNVMPYFKAGQQKTDQELVQQGIKIKFGNGPGQSPIYEKDATLTSPDGKTSIKVKKGEQIRPEHWDEYINTLLAGLGKFANGADMRAELERSKINYRRNYEAAQQGALLAGGPGTGSGAQVAVGGAPIVAPGTPQP